MYEITPATQAILLLTSNFSEKKLEDAAPLSPAEWGRFALWLYEHNLKPENLLQGNFEKLLSSWEDSQITSSRLQILLSRGAALALAMEKWQRVGIWVITRSSSFYPKQLKKKLKHLSPPLLYGIGNPKLLNKPAIAVVGSRNAPQEACEYAKEFGKKIASGGYTLVSGGARGIDESAMLGALQAGGTAIGILPNDLMKASLLSQYRQALMHNDLVLISTHYPEAPFNAVNALENNKYIYAQSTSAVIAHSETRGGTLSGAIEALNKEYTSLWVVPSSKGNKKLIELGANLLPEDMVKKRIDFLWGSIKSKRKPNNTLSLFDDQEEALMPKEINSKRKEKNTIIQEMSFFDFFIFKLHFEYAKSTIFRPKEIEEKFALKPSQVTKWIDEAEDKKLITRIDGKVKKYRVN